MVESNQNLKQKLVNVKADGAGAQCNAERVLAQDGTLKGIAKKVMAYRCYFCFGIGHTQQDCSTRARLKDLFQKAGYSAEWGTAFSAIVQENVAANVANKAARQDLQKQEVELSMKKP